jgi:glucokinase
MKQRLCGVDFGGTKLAVVLTDLDGMIQDKHVVYDHVSKPDHEIARYIVRLVKELLARNQLEETDVEGIGICFPGHLRFHEGVTITTSNLPGFKNFPLRQVIQEHFQVKVILDNDANAQTYAEFLYGAGRGYDSMLFMTISTGIGGGIVLDRKLYRGMTGTAGEFGHIIIDPSSPIRCGCGNYGCLMGCASGHSLPQMWQYYRQQGIPSTLEIAEPAAFNGRLLKRGLDQQDALCERVTADYARAIGIGVYNLFQIFNPPLIVLGGGLVKLGDRFFHQIEATFRELVKDMAYDNMTLTLSALGDDAGLIGAAALLLEDHA